SGSSILKKIKEKTPSVPVIIITGYSNIKTAVEVMKLGAMDYVTKPLLPDEILLTIRKALSKSAEEKSTAGGAPPEESADDDLAVKDDKIGVAKRYSGESGSHIFGDSPDFKNI